MRGSQTTVVEGKEATDELSMGPSRRRVGLFGGHVFTAAVVAAVVGWWPGVEGPLVERWDCEPAGGFFLCILSAT